jgi:hypothetical protein
MIIIFLCLSLLYLPSFVPSFIFLSLIILNHHLLFLLAAVEAAAAAELDGEQQANQSRLALFLTIIDHDA